MNQLIIAICLLLLSVSLNAQKSISMKEAMEQVTTKHPTILQQDLYIEQQLILKDAGKQQPFLGVGYSFEEVGINGTGIHSLYLQQNLNMPQVAKSKAALQEEMAKTGVFQKAATQKQLKRFIASLYQQILFLKNQQILNEDLLEIYQNTENIARKRADIGETGELPVLATQAANQQIQLQQMSNRQNYLVQLEKLKQYLMDSSFVDIADTTLVVLSNTILPVDIEAHPLVKKIEQNISVNNARSLVIQSQLLPQISLGFQTQLVQGGFPFFGGQFGFNVPLFKKGIKAQVQANNLNSKILENNKRWQIQQLDGQQKIALQNIAELQKQLKHIENAMLPTIQKQLEFSEKAYAVGNLGYLNILQSLKQMNATRSLYLQVLLQLNLALIDYEFLVL